MERYDSSEEVAIGLFRAIETGKSWEDCRPYCESEVSFLSPAEPLRGFPTLAGYMSWRPDFLAKYAVTEPAIATLGVSADAQFVTIYATFQAARPNEPRPVPWCYEHDLVHYVYVMSFYKLRVCCLYKIWDAGKTYRQLGLPLPD